MDPTNDIEAIKQGYRNNLATTSIHEAKAMGWAQGIEQQVRHMVLLEAQKPYLWNVDNNLGDVLDLGCGVGDFLRTPGLNNFNMDTYTGVDFMPEFIQQADMRYMSFANVEFVEAEVQEFLGNAKAYNTLIASGLMAFYKAQSVRDMLARMWHVTANPGVMAFNWNKGTSALTLHDMLIILSQMDIQHYTVRADYLMGDKTIYCYKADV